MNVWYTLCYVLCALIWINYMCHELHIRPWLWCMGLVQQRYIDPDQLHCCVSVTKAQSGPVLSALYVPTPSTLIIHNSSFRPLVMFPGPAATVLSRPGHDHTEGSLRFWGATAFGHPRKGKGAQSSSETMSNKKMYPVFPKVKKVIPIIQQLCIYPPGRLVVSRNLRKFPTHGVFYGGKDDTS